MLVDLTDRLGGASIAMNLLEKSGLTGNKVQRDLNLLEDAVGEAARHIREEVALAAALDANFGNDTLAAPKRGKRADGATIAALLWMNAAMLHQRIEAGGWLGRRRLDALSSVKASPEPERLLRDSWNTITRQDFLPVIDPALEALEAAERTGRLGGLRRALRHLAGEAERIAETYADMGTDHAGALLNKVMGDQSSDGAFFTRPVAATITARLALDAADPGNEQDWSDPDVWRRHKTVDLACGSGTLLAAVMTEMKSRAALRGAGPERLAELQKVAVEATLKGLDVNPVSLQLAATQLMAGNTDIKYRGMGLHLMPYGPQPDGGAAAGSLELLGRSEIVPAGRLFDDASASTAIKTGAPGASAGLEMDDATSAVRRAAIVVMNPPFTNRTKMGEKFGADAQRALRRRMDILDQLLERGDPELSRILNKNALRPHFAALSDLCVDGNDGVVATILPTTALTSTSGLAERLLLADRFHVHTIVTHAGAIGVNLSQGTDPKMNESIVVLRRQPAGDRPATRIVALDRFPRDDADAARLFAALDECAGGSLGHGWGEVSAWPAARIAAGDWSAVAWRSPSLAAAAAEFAERDGMQPLAAPPPEREREERDGSTRLGQRSPADTEERASDPRNAANALRQLPQGGVASEPPIISVHATGQAMRDDYNKQPGDHANTFPVLQSKGADGQQRIKAVPDAHWEPKRPGPASVLENAGHLLVTMGQNTSTARLVAVASDERYVGQGWMPVTGLGAAQAKAAAVFLNATPGRLMAMRNPGQSLLFPLYNPAAWAVVAIPDLADPGAIAPLVDCWDQTRREIVPPFRDGYTDVRRRWDEAVCDALDWDIDEVTELGEILAREPRVRGVAYGQWKAE